MPVRVKLTHVARRGSGSVPATTSDASLRVYVRNADGSNGTEQDLYAASTGGSALAKPLNPTSTGHYDAYVNQPGRYNLVETINGIAMPTVAWEAVSTALETVTAVTFSGGWVNYAAGYTSAGYFKTTEGIVVLRGLIKNGVVGATAFILPVGYRPLSTLLFGVVSNNAVGRVDIGSGGNVVPATPSSNAWVALDSIQFRAEQ